MSSFVSPGYPPQTGTATLFILVDDVNDNAPQIVYSGVPMVMELEDPPQYVITFSATDPDSPEFGPPFHFSLPPCEENPTCHNGDHDFTLEFFPSKISTGSRQANFFYFFTCSFK